MLRSGNAPVDIAERLALAEQARPQSSAGFERRCAIVFKPIARRDGKAVVNIAMALPENLQVGGQNQRAALGGAGAGDEVGDEAAVFHEIELEPEGLLDRRRHILDRTDRQGAERVGNAGLFSGARGGDFAVTMRHAGHADRPQCERQCDSSHRAAFAKDRDSRRQRTRVGEF